VKRICIAALVAATIGLGASTAQAQESDVATQVVSFEVQAINLLSVSGSPSLVINASAAGSAPTSVTAGGTYSITTNEVNRKITASIDADMPSGVTLSVLFAQPTGASASSQSLSTSPADVVTAISTLNESGLSLTYTLSASSAAGVVAADTRTVTYTILSGA
jgi:hypothetical protein